MEQSALALSHSGILSLVVNAGLVVKGVLLILLIFSVACWAIILYKYRVIRSARSQTNRFLKVFWMDHPFSTLIRTARQYPASPISRLFESAYEEVNKIREGKTSPKGSAAAGGEVAEVAGAAEINGVEHVQRALNRAMISEITRLERAITFLATTGSTAPFIGLFGTVWGIMDAFHGIGVRGSASLAVVAPGISEALVATAAGLAAAIPAVVAYNHFVRKVRVMANEMENFSSEFLSIAEKHLEG
ncbi:MAG: protein TolQ [Deltaproteobacteria bacterium]|nr:protein TolQ [Deltaproteobacteria bacterium]